MAARRSRRSRRSRRRSGHARPVPKKLYLELGAAPNRDYDESDPRARVEIKPRQEPVRSFREASQKATGFILRHSLGSGNWAGFGRITDEKGRFVARVSYNGRLWDRDGKEIKV